MSNARLIIVDDEPVILRLLTGVFDDTDFEVVSCADAAAARAAIEAGVDVLLTDKNLPDGSGLELLRLAKATNPGCEGLIITGYASIDTVLEAMQLDAFDYIVKPPKDIFEVKRKVGQAYEKVRLRQENAELLVRLQHRNDELQSALDELKAVQAELIQSEKLAGIGTLAAGIAHEISSPLFGMMGLAEAILDEEDRSLVEGYAREIVDYSRTIKEIVQQLSGYSRTAQTEYHTAIALDEVVGDAALLVERTIGGGPCPIVADLPDELLVSAKATELQQVFVNLLKNAVEAVIERHGAEQGRVVVTGGRDADQVWAAVSDDGDGIPRDKIGSIFDPFYTTKAPGKGTGLGLNIVYRIITKYRGTIGVESNQGEGTTFTLRFPAHETD